MKRIEIKNMTAKEIFRQQVSSTMQYIRYLNSGDSRQYIPAQMGGIFVQREILAGGHAMRITEVGND